MAFCDDDDTWARHKLTAQLAALRPQPGQPVRDLRRRGRVRRAPGPRRRSGPVTLDAVSRGRGRTLAASGFLARQDVLSRSAERGGIGLLAEDGPAGAAEMGPAHAGGPPGADRAPRRAAGPGAVAPAGGRTDHAARGAAVDERAPSGTLRRAGRHAARTLAEIACWEAAAGNRLDSWTGPGRRCGRTVANRWRWWRWRPRPDWPGGGTCVPYCAATT